MSTLTTILHRAGLLNVDDVQRVEEHCAAHKRAPFVGLVELGLASEDQLVQMLSSKLMLPVANEAILEAVDAETAAHIPAELAWSYAMVPVSIDDLGNVTIAMADPTDGRAVDVVAAHTSAYIIRAVAPVAALRRCVAHHYGARPVGLRGPPTPLETPAVTDSGPISVVGAVGARPGEPLSSQSFANVLPQLVAAMDRDMIMEVLLDFLATGFERVILFVHLRGQLKGRDARGNDLMLEAITQVRIPTTGPSVFADVIGHGAPYFGAWPIERTIDRAFAGALGNIEGNVLVLPVRVRDRVPVLVFASGASAVIDPRNLERLTSAVQSALERLIFRRKSQA